MIKVYLSDIIITQEFKKSVPKKRKLQKCQKYWENHRQQDRYIVINDKNELIDGYIQYLVLQQNSIDSAECIRSNEKNECWNRKPMITYKDEPTIYILGQHLGQHKENNKIYYWRIPISWTRFAEKLEIGDVIFCSTKFGAAPVKVVGIQKLDYPPLNLKIRRVASHKIKKENEEIIFI